MKYTDGTAVRVVIASEFGMSTLEPGQADMLSDPGLREDHSKRRYGPRPPTVRFSTDSGRVRLADSFISDQPCDVAHWPQAPVRGVSQ